MSLALAIFLHRAQKMSDGKEVVDVPEIDCVLMAAPAVDRNILASMVSCSIEHQMLAYSQASDILGHAVVAGNIEGELSHHRDGG